jgi:hypothetical protein
MGWGGHDIVLGLLVLYTSIHDTVGQTTSYTKMEIDIQERKPESR